jgi:hypothetical protein
MQRRAVKHYNITDFGRPHREAVRDASLTGLAWTVADGLSVAIGRFSQYLVERS